MSELAKITDAHRRRRAVVYVRQSSPGQVERNVESTALQYALADRAVQLGWPAASVSVVDEDLGRSGASTAGRLGFKELVAEVGLGHVGLILARDDVAAGAVFGGLASAAGSVRDDGHADRRRGRHL